MWVEEGEDIQGGNPPREGPELERLAEGKEHYEEWGGGPKAVGTG